MMPSFDEPTLDTDTGFDTDKGLTHRERSLTVGGWMIEPQLGRIRRHGEDPQQLEPKVMDLLLALVEEPGRVWTREELEQQIWNGAFMAKGALKHLVWQLRKDLGDDAKSARYVETIARRGYRWVPQVASEPEPENQRPMGRRLVSRFLGLGVVVSVLLALAAALWLLRARGSDDNTGARSSSRAVPLTALPGNEMGPAASPVGGPVVFAWDGGESSDGGGFDLYRQSGAEGAPEVLVEGPGDEFEPALSPDGRTLAFLRGDSREGGRRLEVLDLVSGDLRTLWEGGLLYDIVWHPNGTEVIASVRPPGSLAAHLEGIPADGGPSRFLTDPRLDGESDLYPTISPNGETLAFYRRGVGSRGAILLRELKSGMEQVLSRDVGSVIGLTFDPDGSGLVLSSDRVPPRGLWWLGLEGGEPQWLGLEGSFATDPTFGSDGGLIYQSQQCDSNVWSYELSSREEAPRAVALPRLASTRQDQQPRISYDGRRVAYLSSRTGAYEIWIADIPDGEPKRVPTVSGGVLSLAWSPQGDRLAYVARTSGGSVVSVVAIDGRSGELPLSSPLDDALNPSWSEDGSSVYYSVKQPDGWVLHRHELSTGSVEDFGSGFAVKEDPETGGLWRVHADRTGLWYSPPGSTPESEFRIAPGLRPIDAENWDTVPGGVVFAAFDRDGSRRLWRWNRASGKTEVLGDLERNLPYPPGLSASRDGARVLWTRLDAVGSDLLTAPWAGVRIRRSGSRLVD